MMRVFVIFCFFATTVLATSSWPSVSYAEVRGYAYNPKGKFPHKDRSGRVMMYEPLVYNGKLAESVVDKGRRASQRAADSAPHPRDHEKATGKDCAGAVFRSASWLCIL
jgi:hypothetical protein